MKFVTYNQLHKNFNQATTQSEKKALLKKFDVLDIATGGRQAEKVSISKYAKAEKVYQVFKSLNRANDLLLILDNEQKYQNSFILKYTSEKADKKEAQLKQLLKVFKLKIVYYSHLATLTNGNKNLYLRNIL